MMFFAQSFFTGGFFGGTGAAGWGKILRERDPEEVCAAREAFGAIPERVRAVMAAMAKRYAFADEWDEDALRAELVRRSGCAWSSHYGPARMEAIDAERGRLNKLAGQMRHFRTAPCKCGGEANLGVSEDGWQVACEACGAAGEKDDQPTVALRAWNSSMRR